MELLQIRKTEINVGLSKEYRLFQISDMHLSYCDELSSELDNSEHEHFHRQWDTLKYDFAKRGNEYCDERYDIEPTVLFELLCKYAIDIKADAMILSGDIMDRVTDSNLRYLDEIFKSLPMPVIYCLGNHCYMNENGEKCIIQYERLKKIISQPEYSSTDFGEFEIVSIDNNKPISKEQLNFLKRKINSAKRLILVMHKPMLLGEFGEALHEKIGDYFFMGKDSDTEETKELVKLVRDNDNRFIVALCGHIHFAREHKITENLMQITTSSGLIGAGREIIIK